MEKPIIHSANDGLRPHGTSVRCIRDIASSRRATRPPLFIRIRIDGRDQSLASLAVRVGNDPDPGARLGKSKVGCADAMPLRIIPEAGQVPENHSQSSTTQRCDILHDDVSRSYLTDQSCVFAPQSALRTGKAGSIPCNADILTRETPADDIDGNSICCKSLGSEGPHVVVLPDIGPVLSQDRPAVRLDLAERDGAESSGSLKAKAEPSYPAEQVQNTQLIHVALSHAAPQTATSTFRERHLLNGKRDPNGKQGPLIAAGNGSHIGIARGYSISSVN